MLFSAPPSLNGASTITVRNAMKEDAGVYTCVATNPANDQQVTASAKVLIKGWQSFRVLLVGVVGWLIG